MPPCHNGATSVQRGMVACITVGPLVVPTFHAKIFALFRSLSHISLSRHKSSSHNNIVRSFWSYLSNNILKRYIAKAFGHFVRFVLVLWNISKKDQRGAYLKIQNGKKMEPSHSLELHGKMLQWTFLRSPQMGFNEWYKRYVNGPWLC